MRPISAIALPAPLREIREQVSQLQLPRSNLDELRPTWEAHVSRARQQIQDLVVEGEGEALYLGALSPGCQACKDGTWDCIFTTMNCNLDCRFCYSPHAIPRDYAGSLMGSTPTEIAANHDRTHITGVSFSGGEPFTDVPKLLEWVSWFSSRYPDNYYWVYTNGLLVDEESLRRLGGMGIDEIRFNLAATDYDHPVVLKNLTAAARLIPSVTVEIPAIPEHSAQVLSCLAQWCDLGVRFLNLHELMYEPGTNSATMPGARQAIVTADGHRSEINPHSRALTLAVMRHVQDESLRLSVNDCSLQSKIRQLRGRRKSLVPLVKAPHERMIQGEVYESYCAFQDGEDYFFFHPDSLDEVLRQHPHYQFVRVVRTAPLSMQDRGRWIAFEVLEHGNHGSMDTAGQRRIVA
jgi:pyruvate formate-lyase activating enzyme-like uncharacterized protein